MAVKTKKLGTFINSHKIIPVALIAVALYSLFQFYPLLNQFVGFGIMLVAPSMMVFAVAIWLVPTLLCAAIAIIYWLAGIRNNILAATASFSISYFVISLLTTIWEWSYFIEIVVGMILAYGLFVSISLLVAKFTIKDKVANGIGIILLGLSLYFTPIVTQPIIANTATTKSNGLFKDAVDKLAFVPYYPTYSSTVYPASVPKLNGYENPAGYTNETITFSLDKAQVKQSGYLENQDKIMNFVDNCTIYKIWSSMENGKSINQYDIDSSLQHPKKCDLISVTPSGKKVYFYENGQKTWFYVKLEQTNFIIEFGNTTKYDTSQRDEVLKIIDSLQPLDKSRIENGNSYGGGFSY